MADDNEKENKKTDKAIALSKRIAVAELTDLQQLIDERDRRAKSHYIYSGLEQKIVSELTEDRYLEVDKLFDHSRIKPPAKSSKTIAHEFPYEIPFVIQEITNFITMRNHLLSFVNGPQPKRQVQNSDGTMQTVHGYIVKKTEEKELRELIKKLDYEIISRSLSIIDYVGNKNDKQ